MSSSIDIGRCNIPLPDNFYPKGLQNTDSSRLGSRIRKKLADYFVTDTDEYVDFQWQKLNR